MLFRALLIGACVFFLTPVVACKSLAPAPEETECIGPPTSFEGGYLQQCLSTDLVFCCAYGFLQPDAETICFHVLCQAQDSCANAWQFIGTECPVQTGLYDTVAQ